jgi:frataxin-like iron-binding protein CyaY
MSNVININKDANIPTNDVLTGAIDELSQVIVLGEKPTGEIYVASSTSDISQLLFLSQCLTVHLNDCLRGNN